MFTIYIQYKCFAVLWNLIKWNLDGWEKKKRNKTPFTVQSSNNWPCHEEKYLKNVRAHYQALSREQGWEFTQSQRRI